MTCRLTLRYEAVSHSLKSYHKDSLIETSDSGKGILVTLICLILFCISISVFGEYKRKEVVRGVITSDRGLIEITAPISGRINALTATSGKVVQIEMPLMTIIPEQVTENGTLFSIEFIAKLQEEKQNLSQQILRISQATKFKLASSKERASGLSSELNSIISEIELLKESLRVEEERVERYTNLSTNEIVSKLELIQQKEKLLLARRALVSAERQHNEYRSRIAQESALEKEVSAESEITVGQLKNNITEIERQLISAELSKGQTLVAPVSGTIGALSAVEGQSVQSNQTLLRIIPSNSSLEAHIFLSPSSIGRVKKGQTVLLRYDSFPYRIFGVHEGKVKAISEAPLSSAELGIIGGVLGQDNNGSYFKAVIELESQVLRSGTEKFDLQVGMELSADIVLEQTPLWTWFINRIVKRQ